MALDIQKLVAELNMRQVEFAGAMVAAEQRGYQQLEEPLRALVTKLEEIFAHPSYRSAFGMLTIHGMGYDGPHCGRELKVAKDALAARTTPGGAGK